MHEGLHDSFPTKIFDRLKQVDELKQEIERLKEALDSIRYHVRCVHNDMGGFEKSRFAVSGDGAKEILRILDRTRV
jgi:hypothetical protein